MFQYVPIFVTIGKRTGSIVRISQPIYRLMPLHSHCYYRYHFYSGSLYFI